MNQLRTLALTGLAFISTWASAGSTGGSNEVPEPGTWALIALAGAIGVAVARSKRK